MAEEIKTPMSDFDKVEQVKDTAEIILLQDGVNARVEAPIFEQKILDKTNDRYLGKAEKGAPNGIASLDENKKVPNENLTFGEVKEGDLNVISGEIVYSTILPINLSLFDYKDITKVDSKRLILEDGTLAPNVQSDCTTFIPVKRGDIIYFTGELGATSIAIAGYKDKSTATFVGAVLQGKGNKYNNHKVTIDDESVNYIMACARNLTYPGTVHKLKLTKGVSKVEELKTDVEELKTEVEELKTDVEIHTCIDKSTKGSVINSSNGKVVDISNQGFDKTEYSDIIPVIPNSIIKVSGWFGEQVGVAGYDANKNYNKRICDSSNKSIYRIEKANSFEITIPNDVYFIRSCSKDYDANKMKVEKSILINEQVLKNTSDIQELKNKELPASKMYVKKINDTSFSVFVFSENAKKHTEHTFIHDYKTNKINGVDVVTSDVWYPQSIIDDGKTIAQGNLNFIYMINAVRDKQGENGHVGAGHGCVVAKWTLFLVDGKPFLPTDNFDILECENFSLKYYANCYAIDKANSPSGENGIPFVDENNLPKIANNHALDATYYNNGRIEHRNKLYIRRDNTSFAQCHAAMNSCFRPYFDKVLVPNDLEFTINRHYNDSSGGLNIDKMGSNINTRTKSRIYCNEVTQLGADGYPYLLKNTILNMDNSKQKNANLYFYYGSSPNWLKVYMQPVICTDNPDNDSSKAEVFNNGDVIDILVTRNFFI